MKPLNIISAYQCVDSVLNKLEGSKLKKNNMCLKDNEANTLSKLIEEFKTYNADFECFNGYYVGYKINQISKEFDLLRFSDDLIINIELKSPLQQEIRDQKVYKQMSQNYYYLKFLEKKIIICTYVEDDGLYQYDPNNKSVKKIETSELITYLTKQQVNYNINPDDLFVPSEYLVSPFNSTDKFLSDEYFLTEHQYDIKKEILTSLTSGEYKLFCLSANAGTGKTLLTYDIAKSLSKIEKATLIIHCGKLNDGHEILISNNWCILPIKNWSRIIDTIETNKLELIIIDEAQRIHKDQLEIIINESFNLKIPILFSYDVKQYLKENESIDIVTYLKSNYSNIPFYEKSLTDKIRTNNNMSSFIQNMLEIGKCKKHLNYQNITIEYFNKYYDIKEYIKSLQKNHNWKAITFTTSLYHFEPTYEISYLCETKAHDVIGQEFRKVVFVMDSNFQYNNQKLTTMITYYSNKGMLYEILTRAVDELKIIVYDNPQLYIKLIEIKKVLFLE